MNHDSNSAQLTKPIYSFNSPRRQELSLPPDVISYLINSRRTTPQIFQKLQKSCKYFWWRKRVIVVDTQVYSEPKYLYYKSIKKCKFNDDFQYWLTSFLSFAGKSPSTFLKYIYRCDLIVLSSCKSNLTFKEICFLLNGGNIEKLFLEKVNIRHAENGSPVSLDQILLQCPKIVKLIYSNLCEIYSTTTFERLVESKRIYNLEMINLSMFQVENGINPKIFCQFIKKYFCPYGKASIVFKCDVPEDAFIDFREDVYATLGSLFSKVYMGLEIPQAN